MRFGLAEKLELLQTMQYMEIGGGAGYTVGLRSLWVLQYKNCLIKEEMMEICAVVGDWGVSVENRIFGKEIDSGKMNSRRPVAS